MSVLCDIDAGGEVLCSEACCSAIRSKARLSYDEVDGMLDGAASDDLPCVEGVDPAAVAGMLRELDALASARRKVRRRRGSVDFETVEAKVDLARAERPWASR